MDKKKFMNGNRFDQFAFQWIGGLFSNPPNSRSEREKLISIENCEQLVRVPARGVCFICAKSRGGRKWHGLNIMA